MLKLSKSNKRRKLQALKDEYSIKFDFEGEDSARDFFEKISAFLLSLDSLNDALAQSFSTDIQTKAQIQFIEKGSILVWLKDSLTRINDEDIKRYVKNPLELLADFLIKAKKIALKKLQEKDTQSLKNALENELENSELKAYGYKINEPLILDRLSKLSLNAKEFKNKVMLVIENVSYEMNESFEYDLKNAANATTQKSIMKGAFIIKKPDLTGESKWEIITDKIIRAKISDEAFLKKLKAREISLSCGDKIEGELLCVTSFDGDFNIIENEYFLQNIEDILKPKADNKALFDDLT